VAETVEGCTWKIRKTCEMTPNRKLSDLECICVDGIHQGESLLDELDIRETCKLLMDHKHLTDPDIGAWPKFFELSFWNRVSSPGFEGNGGVTNSTWSQRSSDSSQVNSGRHS